MSIHSISRERLNKKIFIPEETINNNYSGKNDIEGYESLVILLGTIYLQEKGGQV